MVILCFTLVACGSRKQEIKKVDSPGALYVQGIAHMKKKDWDKAIQSFSKVRENYPFDPIALVAQIKQADSSFEKKAYASAAVTYEDFVNSYPEDENAAYALRRLAECYEKTSPVLERDQSNTFKAIERFTFLKNRYPASPYTKDADAHIKKLTEKLAAREVFVGEFYYRWKRYNASIIRFQYFLQKYPDAKDRDKALYYIALDYQELQDSDKSQAYLDRLKKEYPQSRYLGGPIKRERRSLQVASVKPAAAVAAPAVGAQPAGAAPGAQTAIAQPAAPIVPSYEEKKPRQIDLEPVDPPKSSEAQPAPKEGAQGAPGKAAKDAAATVRKTDDGKKPEAKKTDDGKTSLGFFSEKKPVDVVADSMEGLEKGKIILFKGNVIAKQVDLYLFSDMLTAYVNEETNEIDRAKAEGNVKIVKLDRTATCKEAFFYNDKGEIILKGDVIVFSGKDKVSGDVVTYYINEDRVHVMGQKDKRAKALISPK